MSKTSIWKHWERIAAKYLLDLWYEYLDNNYQIRIWEVDLIFKDGPETVFIEVKTRKWIKYWEGFESVVPQKLNKLARLAQYYCWKNKLNFERARIDVISILLSDDSNKCKIKHFKKVL